MFIYVILLRFWGDFYLILNLDYGNFVYFNVWCYYRGIIIILFMLCYRILFYLYEYNFDIEINERKGKKNIGKILIKMSL